jgi:hypothetical protein
LLFLRNSGLLVMVLAVGGCMAFVTVDVRVDAAARGLRALSRELPGIGARVLTEFARASVPFVQRGMERAFDRPTPYTVSRVTAKFAERGNLRSVVGVPQSNDAAGRPKHEYLRPGALGAVRRNQKKTEFLLTRQGALPAGWIMTPGSFLKSKLDGYGNVPGSYYKQVIRSLQIRAPGDRYFKGVSKASAGRAAKMGVGSEFFAVGRGRNTMAKGGGWLPPGVYRRVADGKKLQQYFKFMPRAAYKRRLDMGALVVEAVKAKGPAIWKSVLRDVTTRVLEKQAMAGRRS